MVDIFRIIRLAAWFFFGVFIAALPIISYAETMEASPGADGVQQYQCGSGPWVTTGDPTDACRAIGGAQVSGGCWTTNMAEYLGSCRGQHIPVYTCPTGQNWTLNGTTCSRPDCVSPETRNPTNGLCVPPACPPAGTTSGSTWYSGSGSAVPSSLCVNGCTYSSGDFGVSTSSQWTSKAGKSTGEKCTTNTATSLPPTDPRTDCVEKGKAYGSVNGTVVCVPATTTTTNKTSTNTSSNGGNSTVTSNESVTCDETGTCTKTTTTNTTSGGTGPGGTGPGSTTTSGTTSTTEPKTTFCQDNPTLSICVTSTFSGACAPGAAPACSGDAVACATATATWKIQCDQSTEPTDAAYLLGKTVSSGGADPNGNPLSPDKTTNIDIAGIVANAGNVRLLNATCIQPPAFTVQGHNYTMPITLFCQFASIVGYLMVAASSVIAVRMISGGA